jgi:hypothetical protein
MEHLDTQSILIIALFAFAINLFIFYSIIRTATNSKALLRNSNAQLRVLIETASATGVSVEKIHYEITINQAAILKQGMQDNDNGLINNDQHKKLLAEILGKK